MDQFALKYVTFTLKRMRRTTLHCIKTIVLGTGAQRDINFHSDGYIGTCIASKLAVTNIKYCIACNDDCVDFEFDKSCMF